MDTHEAGRPSPPQRGGPHSGRDTGVVAVHQVGPERADRPAHGRDRRGNLRETALDKRKPERRSVDLRGERAWCGENRHLVPFGAGRGPERDHYALGAPDPQLLNGVQDPH